MYPQWHTPGTNHLHCLCSETFDGQLIFGLFQPPPTVLTCVKRPTSHASIEMHRKLIMPSSYDSLLCWLVWCLLCHSAAKAQCSGERFFFSHSLPKHSSLAGEQHHTTGRASWGGSGCSEEHLWYGLSEGGQTRTSTSQWHVRPSRLLQQYVSTSWWFVTLSSWFTSSQVWWGSTFLLHECFTQGTVSFSL